MYVLIIYFGHYLHPFHGVSNVSSAIVIHPPRSLLLLRPGMIPLSGARSKLHKLQLQLTLPDRGGRYSIPFMLFVAADSGRLFSLVGWQGEVKSER